MRARKAAAAMLALFFWAGALPPLHGEDSAAPAVPFSHSITFYPQLDVQRSLDPDLYVRAVYDALLWDHVRAAAGASLSFTPLLCVDGYFLDAGVDDILGWGLGAHLKLMGDQYPEYGRAANTIQPYAVWRKCFADLAFGVTWRFLVVAPEPLWLMFYYPSFMVEAIFYYKIGVVFDFFDGFWTFSASLSNQDEFTAGNFGAFCLRMGNRFSVMDRMGLFLDILYRPSGTIALTAVNSVLGIRCGGRVEL